MAAYISFQPSDNFNSVLFSGNDSTNAITGVGFQPDFTWLKGRSNTGSSAIQDSVRGNDKSIRSNGANTEYTNTFFDSFDSDGFTLSTTESDVNASSRTYAAWNWKMGTTSGLTGGTITPSGYSFNQDAGI